MSSFPPMSDPDDQVKYALGVHYLNTEPGSEPARLHEAVYTSTELGEQMRLAFAPLLLRAALSQRMTPAQLQAAQVEAAALYLLAYRGT